MGDDASKTVSEAGRKETEEERDQRRLIELLNELRVALPGVQVLFAFLLIVPFQPGFAGVTDFQRGVYFASLLCATASTVLLIAPSAYHRIVFAQGQKGRVVRTSNGFAIAGLAFLALAIVGVLLLITAYLFGTETAVYVATGAALAFAFFWYALPLYRRFRS